MARARKPGISKAQGYMARVFTIEYDMQGMIQAYGIKFVLQFAQLVADGKIDCRQCVDRWASDRALFGDNPDLFFAEVGNQFLVDPDDIDIAA